MDGLGEELVAFVTYLVMLGKSDNAYEPQFPHLQDGNNNENTKEY